MAAGGGCGRDGDGDRCLPLRSKCRYPWLQARADGGTGAWQLAYDKGMIILAATQAADVALESEKIGQGLLTYALVQEGLGRKEDKKRQAIWMVTGR